MLETLKAYVQPRYWEDAGVNGVIDAGADIPCRNGDMWEVEIDIPSGRILNLTQGVTAYVYFKVCDLGVYELYDEKGRMITSREGYVPKIMYPGDEGYGDYDIMDIDEDGYIKDWEPNFEGFALDEDDDE